MMKNMMEDNWLNLAMILNQWTENMSKGIDLRLDMPDNLNWDAAEENPCRILECLIESEL